MRQCGGEEFRKHCPPEGLSPDMPGMYRAIELNCEGRGELEGRPRFRPVGRRALRDNLVVEYANSRDAMNPEGMSPDRPGMCRSIELNCEGRGELEGRPRFRPVGRRALRDNLVVEYANSRDAMNPEGLSPDRPGMYRAIELNCEGRRALRIPGVEDIRHPTQKPLSESVPIWTHYREPHFESLDRCYNRRS